MAIDEIVQPTSESVIASADAPANKAKLTRILVRPSSLSFCFCPLLAQRERGLGFSTVPKFSLSPAMEFHHRATDDDSRDPYFLSSPSDGYFAAQALRAGILGRHDIAGLPPPPPIPAREALLRELEMERIREEVLLREITQRRILEEQIRRELELERAVAIRRREAEKFEAFGGRMMETEPLAVESRAGETAWADNRIAVPRRPGAITGKKLPLPFKKPEPSTRREINVSHPNLSGTKRKSDGELPRPVKDWSCALCQVTTLSEAALNEHLQGKKHKAKEVFLGTNKSKKSGAKEVFLGTNKSKKSGAKEVFLGTNKSKKSGGTSSAVGPMKNIPGRKYTCDLCEVGAQSLDVWNKHLHGKKHRTKEALLDANNQAGVKKTARTSAADGIMKGTAERKKQQGLWCKLCKVKCNSEAMMACHLKGKKHKAQVESAGRDEVGTASAGKPTAEVVKVVARDQTAKVGKVKNEAEGS